MVVVVDGNSQHCLTSARSKMNPSVSIITPTKNRLKLLCEAMDSVQQQTFDQWEHIIVDDGSDDGTAEEVARRAAADARICYIRRAGETYGERQR